MVFDKFSSSKGSGNQGIPLAKAYEADRDTTSRNASVEPFLHLQIVAYTSVYTTSNGAPVPHPYAVQRAGVNGPLLLQDFHLIDLLSHFDRER